MLTPKSIILIGLLITAWGGLLYWVPGVFSWFGKLPGDIHIKGDGYSLHIPITSMLVVSVILNLLIRLFSDS